MNNVIIFLSLSKFKEITFTYLILFQQKKEHKNMSDFCINKTEPCKLFIVWVDIMGIPVIALQII